MCSKLYHMYTLYQVQYKGILGLNLTWCLIICFPKILLEVWDKEKRFFFFLNIWLKRKKKKRNMIRTKRGQKLVLSTNCYSKIPDRFHFYHFFLLFWFLFLLILQMTMQAIIKRACSFAIVGIEFVYCLVKKKTFRFKVFTFF